MIIKKRKKTETNFGKSIWWVLWVFSLPCGLSKIGEGDLFLDITLWHNSQFVHQKLGFGIFILSYCVSCIFYLHSREFISPQKEFHHVHFYISRTSYIEPTQRGRGHFKVMLQYATTIKIWNKTHRKIIEQSLNDFLPEIELLCQSVWTWSGEYFIRTFSLDSVSFFTTRQLLVVIVMLL